MRIALDAMGGDHAPVVPVQGAILAAQESAHEIILVGKKDIVAAEVAKYKTKNLRLSIVDAQEVIEMDDSPALAVRQKKDSSMNVAARLVSNGKAEAFVSAGNSGAVMAASLLEFGRVKGVSRPALAVLAPSVSGIGLLIDAGANVDCKPKHLLQFGVMGSIYSKNVLNRENPRVGLLSIGEEDSKGNEVTLSAFELLRKSNLNFVGNIEGRDIFRGKADVAICDGFVGNVLVKAFEGVVEMLFKLVRIELKKYPIAWVALPFIWSALNDLRKRFDYSTQGGAPLLGVNGACLISHGRSTARAIKNAIFNAARFVEKNVNDEIAQELSKMQIDNEDD